MIQGIINMASVSDPASVLKTYALRNNYFNMENYFLEDGLGMERLVAGMIGQEARNMDRFVTEDVTNFLFLVGGQSTANLAGRDFGGDLIARNIQRGRDHGLPGYNKFRKYCNLKDLPSFR